MKLNILTDHAFSDMIVFYINLSKSIMHMKRLIVLMSVLYLTTLCFGQGQKKEITFADPTIFAEGGKYYMTGTRNREPLGFGVLESTDLVNWSVPNGDTLQLILAKGQGAFGTKGFWAPQYFKHRGRKSDLLMAARRILTLSSSGMTMVRYISTM